MFVIIIIILMMAVAFIYWGLFHTACPGLTSFCVILGTSHLSSQVLFPFYRWNYWVPERSGHLPRVLLLKVDMDCSYRGWSLPRTVFYMLVFTLGSPWIAPYVKCRSDTCDFAGFVWPFDYCCSLAPSFASGTWHTAGVLVIIYWVDMWSIWGD